MAHQGNPNYGGNQQAGFVVNPQQPPPGSGGVYPSAGPGFPNAYNPNQQPPPHLSNPGFQPPPPAVGQNVNWCGTVPPAQPVNPYPVQGHPAAPVYYDPSAPSFNPSPITPQQQIPHDTSYPIQQGAVQDNKHHTGKDKKKDEKKKNKRRVFVQLVQNEFECDDSDADGVEFTPASLALNKPKKDKKDKKDKDKKDKDKKDKDKTKKKNIYRLKKVAVIQDPSELEILRHFSYLPMEDQMYKNIEQYVNNSVDMKIDSKGGGGVKIHKIYQVTAGGMPTTSGGLGWNSGPVATMPLPGAPPPTGQGASTLLWYKTTRESAQRLQMGGTVIPFYDRLARALPVQPKELGQPLRQVVLLCSVSLGTEYKASEGSNSKSWRTGATQFPQGHDSVLIPGRCVPDWGDKRDKVQDPNLPRIPYGRTRKSGDKKKEKSEKIKISGDYNVFLIQDVRRAQVKYAVDVEIIPGNEDKDKSKNK